MFIESGIAGREPSPCSSIRESGPGSDEYADLINPVWSKYSTGQFSARSRMMHGHHAKQKMGAVVGLCNRSGKPAVAAAKRIPGGREPDLAITPSHPSAAVRSGAIHPG